MLNTPCLRPQPIPAGDCADFSKVATYYRNRARCCEAAAAGSFGWRREAYAAEAAKYRKSAAIADDLHRTDRSLYRQVS